MNKIIILGAGGHAKVVADILQLRGYKVAGFLDDDPKTWGTRPLGLPVLGGIERCLDGDWNGLVLGVGANRVRREIVKRLGAAVDHLWINAIHPSAVVASSALLGRGIVIAANAVINPDVILGNHVIVNTAATVDHDCRIGHYAHIAPGVHLCGGTQIGHGTLVGVGTCIVPNVTVGNWAIVGAGATVIRNIPGHTTALGTPAIVKETIRANHNV